MSFVVHSYGYLYHASKWSVSRDDHPFPDSKKFEKISAVVLLGFTAEAFLNHVGALQISDWEKNERSLNARKRLSIVLDAANLSLDEDTRPWSTLKELRQIRDMLAHPRSEVIDDYALGHFMTDQMPADFTEWWARLRDFDLDQAFDDVNEFVESVWSGLSMEGPNPLELVGSSNGT